ncbi:MAG: hypothetical protein GY948_22140 [Alphaproteobacteria bacterium]|nr:hypothetical protein [Alphaproteobacteria bacterium]
MQAKQDADIIEFRPVPERKGLKKRRLAPAQVIIFPGVRIERRKYSLADRLPMGSRKTR